MEDQGHPIGAPDRVNSNFEIEIVCLKARTKALIHDLTEDPVMLTFLHDVIFSNELEAASRYKESWKGCHVSRGSEVASKPDQKSDCVRDCRALSEQTSFLGKYGEHVGNNAAIRDIQVKKSRKRKSRSSRQNAKSAPATDHQHSCMKDGEISTIVDAQTNLATITEPIANAASRVDEVVKAVSCDEHVPKNRVTTNDARQSDHTSPDTLHLEVSIIDVCLFAPPQCTFCSLTDGP